MKTGWGPKSGNMLNEYRSYILDHTDPDDVVMIFDALDVVFQGGEEELMQNYLSMEQRTGREMVYNADTQCSSPRQAEYPPSDTPWRYLNGGVVTGRSRALRQLFRDKLPDIILDAEGRPMRNQNWHTNFYLDHQELVMIDTKCELTQVIMRLDSLFVSEQESEAKHLPGGDAMDLSGGRVHNRMTNTTPLVLHFPGPGHWPEFMHPERVGTCLAYEVMRSIITPGMTHLMEDLSFTQSSGKMFGQPPWKGICTFYVSPFDYVGFKLQHLGDWILWAYFHTFWRVILLIGMPVVLVLVRKRRTFQGPLSEDTWGDKSV